MLARDSQPGIFPYFQEFTVPDTGERLVRKGFIALGAVEDYAAAWCTGTSRRSRGRRRTGWSCCATRTRTAGRSSCCIPTPRARSTRCWTRRRRWRRLPTVTDEYGAVHRVWRMADAARVQQLMADKKLLIADGHHRYETALAFRNENPGLPGADRVMMTFVNMHSPGLKILATHRLVSGLDGGDFADRFLWAAAAISWWTRSPVARRLKRAWDAAGDRTIIGAAIGNRLFLLEHRRRAASWTFALLHEVVLGQALGIGEEAVRDEKHLRYIRGLDAAVQEVRQGAAQIAFLLKPVGVEQVAATSFAGGVMPQKSTDFYPKLLSGLTIYRVG
jgi:uncharacterized protein (DUF1015 family)